MENEYKCFWCGNCTYFEEDMMQRVKCINTDCIIHGMEEESEVVDS